MMTAHPSTAWRCMVRPPQPPLLQFLVLVLMLMCAHPDFASATPVNTNAWLSGPAAVWDIIIGTPATETAMKAAAQMDLQAAVQSIDSSAQVVVNGLTSYKSQQGGPAYGANAAFSVTTEKPEEEVLSAVRSSVMTNMDTIFIAAGLDAPITALMAKEPSAMTSVGPVLLPVMGSTYFWYVLLETLASTDEMAVALFMHPLQVDIQSAVDSTVAQFLIEATPSSITVNASSFYVSYTVWAFPEVEVGSGTPDKLKALAMGSRLSQFNSYLESAKDLYPDLQDYRDLFPTAVRPWTPPPGNPFEEESGDTGDTFPVLANNTGDYSLLFSGEAEQWGVVWEKQSEAVSASIEKAIEVKLHRRTFVNRAFVASAETVASDAKQSGGLRVLCRVVQGLTRFSNHTWSPEELASLLLQADYSETQALYASGGSAVEGVAPRQPRAAVIQPTLSAFAGGGSPGSITTATVNYNYSTKLSKEMTGVIVMAALIVGVSLIIIIVTVCCCCLCPNFTRPGLKSKRSSRFSIGNDP
ncbi:hypothetical protein LSCM4_04714 [Leishmania orientalis]|uniref:Uncharacterized protein n=1 Tax=Leishmania orientalis TaxID=2249476 RepID=A0A836HIF2_9TRYP|nr:hypothetical protein LSCM4_04714 [Leishmania orientalis]